MIPRVLSVALSTATSSSVEEAKFNVTFSEMVYKVDITDFMLVASGSATGRISAIVGCDNVYVVTVSSIAGAGVLHLDVLAGGYMNPFDEAGLGFTGSMSHTVERVPPELVALTARGSTLTAGAAVVFDVRFSEAVTGLDATDFVLIADDTATATLSLVANDATSYTLTIDTIVGEWCAWFAVTGKCLCTDTVKVMMV